MNKQRFRMSRQTASWLVAIFAALVVIHYAYHTSAGNLARTVMSRPAVAVALNGEVTHIGDNQVTITLAGPQGDLTNLTRTVTISGQTRFSYPGQPDMVGPSGMNYVREGYRVTIQGAGSQGFVNARLVKVNFPPLQGTVVRATHQFLTVNVPGQSMAARIRITPHTGYVFAHGRRRLVAGTPVTVSVIPNQEPDSGLTAVTITVPASHRS